MRVNHLPSHETTAPSPTSYLIQRIRLSEICRTIVDRLPCLLDDPEGVNYEHVTELDSQFEEAISNFPYFFHLHCADNDLPQQIITQRYLIHLGFHTRRSKLHQPFLVRGFIDPKYSFSRNACLQSARAVLEVYRMLEAKKSSPAYIPARLGMVVQHVFMAAVVLVMDLCFNKDEGREEQRQSEVMQACQMLTDLKRDSDMAAKFLNPLMEILQKHKARFSQAAMSLPGSVAGVQAPVNNDHHPDNLGFDEMMQNYIDLGQNADIPAWGDLFAEFDSYGAIDTEGNGFFIG